MKHLHSPIRYGFSIAEARLVGFATNPEATRAEPESNEGARGDGGKGKTNKELKTDLADAAKDLMRKLNDTGDSAFKNEAIASFNKQLDTSKVKLEELDGKEAEIVEKAKAAIAKVERGGPEEGLDKDPKDVEMTQKAKVAWMNVEGTWLEISKNPTATFGKGVPYNLLKTQFSQLLKDIAAKKPGVVATLDAWIKRAEAFVDGLKNPEKKETTESLKKIEAAQKKLNDAWDALTKKATPGKAISEKYSDLQGRYSKFKVDFIANKPIKAIDADAFATDVDAFAKKISGDMKPETEKDKEKREQAECADKIGKVDTAWKALKEKPALGSKLSADHAALEMRYAKFVADMLRGVPLKKIEADAYSTDVDAFIKTLATPEESEDEKNIRECRERANKVAEKIRLFALQSDRDSRVADRMLADVEKNLENTKKPGAVIPMEIASANNHINKAEEMYTTEKGWEDKKWSTLTGSPENKWMTLPGNIGKPGFVYMWNIEGEAKQVYAYSPAMGASSMQSMDGTTKQWTLISDVKKRDELVKTVPADGQKMIEDGEKARLEKLYPVDELWKKIKELTKDTSLTATEKPASYIRTKSNSIIVEWVFSKKGSDKPKIPQVEFNLPGSSNAVATTYPPIEELARQLVQAAATDKNEISTADRQKLDFLRRSEGLMAKEGGALAKHQYKLDGRKPYVEIDGFQRWINTKLPVWELFDAGTKKEDVPNLPEPKDEVAKELRDRLKKLADVTNAKIDAVKRHSRQSQQLLQAGKTLSAPATRQRWRSMWKGKRLGQH